MGMMGMTYTNEESDGVIFHNEKCYYEEIEKSTTHH